MITLNLIIIIVIINIYITLFFEVTQSAANIEFVIDMSKINIGDE